MGALRELPAVHVLLGLPALAEAVSRRGRPAVLEAIRRTLDDARRRHRLGEAVDVRAEAMAAGVLAALGRDRPALRPVINATGVLLHTGLGRSPLAAEAITAVAEVARGYCSLELDLESGTRGRRADGVAALLRRLTGAPAAAVVNNNAAATVLALRALAAGREVIVSRGQLVEIGGSFRLPEIMEVSGARLREVGTTNRTRLADYERAIGPETAALLRIHPSNYRIVGFTEEVGIAELAALGKARGLWTIDDIGSGALAPGVPPAVGGEPTAAEGLAAGADVVLFSGDKLLGGPQCGILLGAEPAIARLAADPLMRALRVDKLTLAALEATLRLAMDPPRGARGIPLWSRLAVPAGELEVRAGALAGALSRAGFAAEVVATTGAVGGGSAPVVPVASWAVRLAPPYPGGLADEGALAAALRGGEPAVLARVQGGAVLLDLRAVAPDELPALERALQVAGGGAG
jgi:L-seryl-tRNA(Ser) seleniumtransferase